MPGMQACKSTGRTQHAPVSGGGCGAEPTSQSPMSHERQGRDPASRNSQIACTRDLDDTHMTSAKAVQTKRPRYIRALIR